MEEIRLNGQTLVNGTDYTTYYTYGVQGTNNGYVVLVVNDNLNITIQEASNANFVLYD